MLFPSATKNGEGFLRSEIIMTLLLVGIVSLLPKEGGGRGAFSIVLLIRRESEGGGENGDPGRWAFGGCYAGDRVEEEKRLVEVLLCKGCRQIEPERALVAPNGTLPLQVSG